MIRSDEEVVNAVQKMVLEGTEERKKRLLHGLSVQTLTSLLPHSKPPVRGLSYFLAASDCASCRVDREGEADCIEHLYERGVISWMIMMITVY